MLGSTCACCSWMPQTTCSSAASRRCAGPTRCRATGRSSTASGNERARLAHVRESADLLIDTSRTTSTSSRRRWPSSSPKRARPSTPSRSRASASNTGCRRMPISSPTCASCPNPFWNEELRAFTGEDDAVRDYVLAQEGARDSWTRTLPRWSRSSRATSERTSGTRSSRWDAPGESTARSPMANELAARLSQLPGLAVRVKHRDLGRE